MGSAKAHDLVMPVLAAFSRYEEAIGWARTKAEELWGPVLLESEYIPFVETSYYEKEMGTGLKYRLFSFETLLDPTFLVEAKLASNRLEECYRAGSAHPEARPLNLDPGYLEPGKFVLASTKDASHRIYLSQGIFAEVTLYFCHGEWREREWTYPNYRGSAYKRFLFDSREKLLLLRKKQD